MEKVYVDTVRLLLETVPEVFTGDRFAMKGGTALNFFVHDMPRLSVDIDVVYLSYHNSRSEALADLAGHNRPVHEVLFSRDVEMAAAYKNEFAGMTRRTVSLSKLQSTRACLRHELVAALTKDHKQFLLGLVTGDPPWHLMSCRHLADLPAVQWKLQNLARLKKTNPAKFRLQAAELEKNF